MVLAGTLPMAATSPILTLLRLLTFPPTGRSRVRLMMMVELVYFADCPNWRTGDRRLRRLAEELRVELRPRARLGPQGAESAAVAGPPTIPRAGPGARSRPCPPPMSRAG